MIPDESKYTQAIALWRDWNSRINVISRKDEDNIYAHHILHSLAIVKYLEIYYPVSELPTASKTHATLGNVRGGTMSEANGGVSLLRDGFRGCRYEETFLDVGCGGGFPGIPLAMQLPENQFTLVDSIGKKIKVASAVAEGLGLKNVRCIQARAEDLEGEWDWVVSRAVTSLDRFYPWVKGKFRKSILYLKGGDINAEISELIAKFKIPPENIRTWKINNWLNDEYFAEKFVIEIGKNYLCTPKSKN